VDDTELLDEVVVVGYGSQKKVNMTGAVATIDSKTLASRPISNISQGLQGLAPGVTVTNAGGQPGQDTGKILIRGLGSFNASSPMVLIDGVEGDMNVVDPNDIESISVLKDASSAAIYGSKAANGVILITTKRGQSGKPNLTYSALFGWSKPADLMDRTTSAELAELNTGMLSLKALLLNKLKRENPTLRKTSANMLRVLIHTVTPILTGTTCFIPALVS